MIHRAAAMSAHRLRVACSSSPARSTQERYRFFHCDKRLGAATGSHVLAYANTAQGTEANALYGTPDEICSKLEALQAAGVEYVILTLFGGAEQLRRFARDVMPAFS